MALGGIGSAARSGVPLRENTNATCGNLAIILSLMNCIACDCDSDVLGIRFTSMTMFFSSSFGMNSWPRWENSSAAPANDASPAAIAGIGLRMTADSTGRYSTFKPRTKPLSRSFTFPVTRIAIIAGMKVSDRTKAVISAIRTVSAIGWKVLPSTPENVSKGT